jgi:hypothetical protein
LSKRSLLEATKIDDEQWNWKDFIGFFGYVRLTDENILAKEVDNPLLNAVSKSIIPIIPSVRSAKVEEIIEEILV